MGIRFEKRVVSYEDSLNLKWMIVRLVFRIASITPVNLASIFE